MAQRTRESMNPKPKLQEDGLEASATTPRPTTEQEEGVEVQIGKQTSKSEQIYEREKDEEQYGNEKLKWSEADDEKLLFLHGQWGNKWTDISYSFEMRDHNCIKNHFYAQIRKSIRRINAFIKAQLAPNFKILNMTHVSKMITMLSEKTIPSVHLLSLIADRSDSIRSLKQQLFQFARKDEFKALNEDELRQLEDLLSLVGFFLNEIKKVNLISKKKNNKTKFIQNLTEYHGTFSREKKKQDQRSAVKVEESQVCQEQPHQLEERCAPSFMLFEQQLFNPFLNMSSDYSTYMFYAAPVPAMAFYQQVNGIYP